MTRNNTGEQAEFNLEIEAFAQRLHAQTLWEKRRLRQQQLRREFEQASESDFNFEVTNEALNTMGDQTIEQLTRAPDNDQPLCIAFPNGETYFQLKMGLIQLLPTFHGLSFEKSHNHLK